MRFDFRNPTLHLVLALLAGLGLGLAYSWLISPVTYVDANPAILRADFKDQYRIVIAASYASTHDLARARARLNLLGAADQIAELSAQAQRMLAANESFERVRPLAQLATDLQQGFTFAPSTNAPPLQATNIPYAETSIIEQPFTTEIPYAQETPLPIEGASLAPPPLYTFSPRPTFTPVPTPGAPYVLVGQDTVCDPTLKTGLLQIILMNSNRRQMPGVEIIATWDTGESHFFTGFKPELGNGYADFIMKAGATYNIRVVKGGAFVPNITAPTCTDPAGANYLGGLLLTFQQP